MRNEVKNEVTLWCVTWQILTGGGGDARFFKRLSCVVGVRLISFQISKGIEWHIPRFLNLIRPGVVGWKTCYGKECCSWGLEDRARTGVWKFLWIHVSFDFWFLIFVSSERGDGKICSAGWLATYTYIPAYSYSTRWSMSQQYVRSMICLFYLSMVTFDCACKWWTARCLKNVSYMRDMTWSSMHHLETWNLKETVKPLTTMCLKKSTAFLFL